MTNQFNLSRQMFDEQLVRVRELNPAEAQCEFRERLAAGQMPLVRAFGFENEDTESLLWREIQRRVLPDDEIAHYFIYSADQVVARGLALWRQAKTRTDDNSTVE